MMAVMNDLRGRSFLVTGANTGIGKETARALAQRGARVTMAGRAEEKVRAAMADIVAGFPAADLAFLRLDLGDLGLVRAAAADFLARDEPLHVLINNAGLAGSKGMTASGFEIAFGTNHVGPFLFTSLLLDRLKQADGARIVNVASAAHYQATGLDRDAARPPPTAAARPPEPAGSKSATVLHAQELARRLEGTGVTTYSLHPGVIASDVWRKVPWPVRGAMKLFMKSTADGAKTTLHCATAAEAAGESGLYYDAATPKRPSPVATPELAAELWRRSEAWVAGG